MTTATITADICLYGNRETGAGWLARTSDGTLLGDGEPRVNWNFTYAINDAADAIVAHERANGRESHYARVFASGGRMMATMSLKRPGWFGDLKWEQAPVLEISAEAIDAAATR